MPKQDQALSYVEHLSYLTENEPFKKYLLLSESSYLKTIVKSRLKKKLSEICEFETFTLFGDEFDFESFRDILDQNLFFSKGKFINVKKATSISKANLNKIISSNLFSKDLQDTFIIFEDDVSIDNLNKDFLKAFDSFKILSNESMSKTQIASWLDARLKSFKLDFPKDIPKIITNISENNIDYAIQIVDRLSLLSPKDEEEWKKAISNFPKEENAVIFDLSDALLEKKNEKALKIFSLLLEDGVSFENILYYLINHYSFLCEVKLYSLKYNTKKEIISAMHDKNAYRVEKAFLQVKKVSLKSLNKALSSLIKIEKGFKSGQLTNISNALPLFIGGGK